MKRITPEETRIFLHGITAGIIGITLFDALRSRRKIKAIFEEVAKNEGLVLPAPGGRVWIIYPPEE